MKSAVKYVLFFPAMLVLLMLAGCGNAESNDNGALEDNGPPQVRNIGQGGTVFVLEVTDNSGTVSVWNVYTDETTVGAALLEHGLIKGDAGNFGLMVTHVSGIRADYNEDGAYWAFYIDGEFAATGVDATDIEQGKVYALVYTKA